MSMRKEPPPMANRSTQLIIVLAAVLLAVIAGSGLVLWLLNNSQIPEGSAPTETALETTQSADVDSSAQPRTGASFNTNVLRSSRYTTLDQQLVTDGSLPVQPP